MNIRIPAGPEADRLIALLNSSNRPNIDSNRTSLPPMYVHSLLKLGAQDTSTWVSPSNQDDLIKDTPPCPLCELGHKPRRE